MSNSFVKRAPEIAEEILLKAASGYLPDVLRTYAKNLLSKEASDDREKLVAPERMALSELQKIAHSNKVTLPLIASVNSDDWSSIAGDLVKMASRHEAENGREIFENAAAMVAMRKEAGGVARGARRAAGAAAGAGRAAGAAAAHAPAVHVPQPQGKFKQWWHGKDSPVDFEHRAWEGGQRASLSRISGTTENVAANEAARQSAASAAESSAKADAQKRHFDLKDKAVSSHHGPLMAAAVGVPVAAMAMRRDPAKREDVRIYK
jgi:Cu/Ag efflux protein CusF